MGILIDKSALQDEEKSSKLEWLETNGLGGWASGTLSGINSRRYHGLLVAATEPPVGRMVMVSKIAETLFTSNGNYELDANNFNGSIHPQGFKYLNSFQKENSSQFEYDADGIIFEKSIAMVHQQNTTILKYELKKGAKNIKLKIKPFISGKNYHWLSKANEDISLGVSFKNDVLKCKPYSHTPNLYIKIPNSEFHYSPDWYYNYFYSVELERVQDFKEDLFTYGEFYIQLKQNEPVYILLSIEENLEEASGEKLFKAELERKNKIANEISNADEFLKILLQAADQFIVKRGENLKTIIAGYHWFADWGRDTMISLPGLCLETGRFEDARKILLAFAKVVDKGMIPNRFADFGEEPEYNNVDGTLWFFIALYEYLQKTKDFDFVKNDLLPVLNQIIDWHHKGTRYGIKVDVDGLLQAGESGSQLTWMDAKVGEWVVTPRAGKPVEINALWYNLHHIMAYIYSSLGDINLAKEYEQKAKNIKESFSKLYIEEGKMQLADNINFDGSKDWAIRPNQLFAISLPFELTTKAKALDILKIVKKELLTPKGLRSLSSGDENYKAFYRGDQLSRDGAYHQGTVWSWLVGAYLVSKVKYEGKKAEKELQSWFENFEPHLSEACIGNISEIFDATSPFEPKGCTAQAWGVAEILRSYVKFLEMKSNL